MVRDRTFRVVICAKPQRLDRPDPERRRTADVVVEAVADVQGLARRDAELVERALEDRRVRLALPHLAREDDRVDALGEALRGEELADEATGRSDVGDDPELQLPLPQRLEQSVSVLRQ